VLCLVILTLSALVIYVLPLLWYVNLALFHDVPLDLTNRDFVNYWMAARFTLDGTQRELFTHDIYFARLQQMFGPEYPIHSWSYPPHFLLFLWPLGFLSYERALAVFLAVTLAMFVAAALAFRRRYAADSDRTVLALALAAFSMMMILATQNGFLTAALLLYGLAWMKDRPLAAGLAFACLTIKPQLGFLLPLLLLLDRNWRVIAWTACFSLLLVGISIACFGLKSWHAYLTETLAYQRFVMTNWGGPFLYMMPTTFGSVRTLGFQPATGYVVQWLVSVVSALLVLWLLWREVDPLRRVFIVVCGTLIITPYAFNYDMGALAVVCAVMLGSNRFIGNRGFAVVLAILAALPALVANLGRANVPISPLILAAALLVVATGQLRDRQLVA
jgi:hypothetical protein